jgi:nucleotide-binding universal stress UspA family protein
VAAQPRRILVAFDGSDAAWRALDAAIRLTGYGSTLTVATVAPEGHTPPARLDDVRERVHARGLTAAYVQRAGDPAEELLRAAEELGAELLVVGRSGAERGDAEPAGSVSATLVRRARCDVLVVG